MGRYQQSQEGFMEDKIFYKHKDFVKCSEGCITNLIWQMIQIKIFQESTEQILINSMHLELDVWPMLDTAVGVKEASTLRRCWAWSCSPEALGSRGLCPSS